MQLNNIMIEGTGNMMTMKYSLLPSDEIDDTVLERLKTNSPEGIVPIQVMDISGVRTLCAQFAGGTTLRNYLKNVLDKSKVLGLLKNLIACMDIGKLGIPVNYIAKQIDYIYVDDQTLKASCFVIPVKGEINDTNEVRKFLRSVVSRMSFSDADTDNYVARILTILNSEKFAINDLNVLVSEMQLEMEEAQISEAFNQQPQFTAPVPEVPQPITPIEEAAPEEPPIQEQMPEPAPEEPQPTTPIEEAAPEEPPAQEQMPEPAPEEPQPITPIEEVAPEEPQGPMIIPGFATGPSFEESLGDDVPKFAVPSQEEISRYNDGLDNGTLDSAPVKRFDPMTGQPLENNNIPMGQPFNPFNVESPFIPQNPIYNPFGEPAPMNNPFAGQPPMGNPFAGQPPMDNPFAGQPPVANPTMDQPPMDNQFIGQQPVQNPIAEQAQEQNTLGGPIPPAQAPSDGQPQQDPDLPRPHFVRDKTGEKIFIDKDEFRIGKSKIHSDYAIENNTAISRVHVIVTKRNGASYLRDNESTNGTWIEGERLEPGREVLLKANMKVKFGDEDFTFYLREGV